MSQQPYYHRYLVGYLLTRFKILFAAAAIFILCNCAETNPSSDKQKKESPLVFIQAFASGTSGIISREDDVPPAPAPAPAPGPTPAPTPAPAPAPGTDPTDPPDIVAEDDDGTTVPAPAPAPAPGPAPADDDDGAAPGPVPAPAPAGSVPVPAPAPAPGSVGITGESGMFGIATVTDMISAATWDPTSMSIVLGLNLGFQDRQATVWNLQTGELLMVINITDPSNPTYTINSTQFTNIPCEIAIYTSGRFQTATVANTGLPACAAGINTIPIITSQFPSAQITSLATDITIPAGTVIDFTAADIPGGVFVWRFGGAAPDSAMQNPGPVTYSTPGTYVVTLDVMNANGIIDPVPDFRIITVIP